MKEKDDLLIHDAINRLEEDDELMIVLIKDRYRIKDMKYKTY